MVGDCILRISKDEYEESLFEKRRYYVGIRRRWELGRRIFFARKVRGRDSFIGHGTLREVLKARDLPKEERELCQRMGWNRRLGFEGALVRYLEPLPIKDILGDGLPRGNRLHGYPLTEDQARSILSKE